MPDKYIRVSNYLHEKLKIESVRLHMSMKELAESYIWQILRKNERSIPHDKSKR